MHLPPRPEGFISHIRLTGLPPVIGLEVNARFGRPTKIFHVRCVGPTLAPARSFILISQNNAAGGKQSTLEGIAALAYAGIGRMRLHKASSKE
jgi:hypothetical protein